MVLPLAGKAGQGAKESANEDARFVLPNAAATRLVMTMNARELMHFFSLRCCNRAQWEIREMAWQMLALCKQAAPACLNTRDPRAYPAHARRAKTPAEKPPKCAKKQAIYKKFDRDRPPARMRKETIMAYYDQFTKKPRSPRDDWRDDERPCARSATASRTAVRMAAARMAESAVRMAIARITETEAPRVW